MPVRIRITLALVMLVAAPACRSDAPTGPSAGLSGVWVLTAVDKTPLPWVYLVIGTDTTFVTSGTIEFTADSLWVRTSVTLGRLAGSPVLVSGETSGRFIEHGVSVVFLSETGAHVATNGWKWDGILAVKSGDGPSYTYERSPAAP